MTGIRKITSFDHLFSLAHTGPESGHAKDEAVENLSNLMIALTDHQQTFGGEPKGKLVISITPTLTRGGSGVTFEIEQSVTPPKRPKASGAAFVSENGQLTLDSTDRFQFGEIRDVSHFKEIKE